METVFLVLLVLVVLGTFALAYFAYQTTWHWPHVTLVVLNILVAIVLTGMTARMLRVEASWRKAVRDYDQEIEKLQQLTAELTAQVPTPTGSDGERNRGHLQGELFRLNVGRGEVWRELEPGVLNPQTGEVNLNFAANLPEAKRKGPEAKSEIYLFTTTTPVAPGAYLGKFRVTGSDAKGVRITVIMPPTPRDMMKLQMALRGGQKLAAYYVMPSDDPVGLAALSDEQRKQLFPNLSPEDLLKLADPKRTPVDFAVALDHIRMEFDLVQQETAIAEDELARMLKSNQDAQAKIEQRNQEKMALAADLEKFGYESQELKKVVGRATAHLQKQQQQLAQVLAKTRADAQAIRTLQTQGAQQLN